jgi:allantoicase
MKTHKPTITFDTKPQSLPAQVQLDLIHYSESSFTDPHGVISHKDPVFIKEAYSHIGKVYEGIEPYRIGGHSVTHDETKETPCIHHYDPNYRDFFTVSLEERTQLKTLCVNTRFFTGNPASSLVITLFDALLEKRVTIPLPELKPDCEHWIENIDFPATEISLHFKAGGITRFWAYGNKTKEQQKTLTWLSKNAKVLFKEDDFFGGPNFALSQKANRQTEYMLGWESSRKAMGLQAVFPITPGVVEEIIIDTFRHVNNYLRSAWVFSANLPQGHTLHQHQLPLWHVTSSHGDNQTTNNLNDFFKNQQSISPHALPEYNITPKAQTMWTLETSFKLHKDAFHKKSNLSFKATHLCLMFLPHGGLHAIKILGTPLLEVSP